MFITKFQYKIFGVWMMIGSSTRGSLDEDTHTALILYANMPANFGSRCNPTTHQPDEKW